MTQASPADVEQPSNEQRKADHIRINLEEDVAFKRLSSGFDDYFFLHQALPELDLAAIDTSTTIFGKALKTPAAHFFDDRRHG